MMGRTRLEATIDKQRAVKQAESKGEVSDSLEVRMALIDRMNKGEITLEQVKAELKVIKRKGRRDGKLTREEVYRHA